MIGPGGSRPRRMPLRRRGAAASMRFPILPEVCNLREDSGVVEAGRACPLLQLSPSTGGMVLQGHGVACPYTKAGPASVPDAPCSGGHIWPWSAYSASLTPLPTLSRLWYSSCRSEELSVIWRSKPRDGGVAAAGISGRPQEERAHRGSTPDDWAEKCPPGQ